MWQVFKNLTTREHAWGRMWQLLKYLITMKHVEGDHGEEKRRLAKEGSFFACLRKVRRRRVEKNVSTLVIGW
jgi:hypothetical protein